jgi:hypothetical protein
MMYIRRSGLFSRILPAGILTCILLLSCGRNQELADVKPDSVGIPGSYEDGGSFPANRLPEQLQEWMRFYHQQDSGFTLDKFQASGVVLHFGPLPEATGGDFKQKKPFYPLLALSPDSSLAIDGYSYNHMIETDSLGMPVILGGEADQEVSIVQTRTGVSRQIMFNGPGLTMEAAGWINPSSFLLATVETDPATSRFRPEILLFNLQDSTFTNFRCTRDFPEVPVSGPTGNFEQAWCKKRNVKWK